MKVLFVMSDLFYGGAESQIRNIISALCSKGIDVFIAKENIETNFITEQEKEFLSKNHIFENRIYNLHNLNKDFVKGVFFYLKNIAHCIKTINKINIVFVYDKFGILAIPFFFFLKIKVLYSERNSGEIFKKHWLYRFFFRLFKPTVTCNSNVAKEILEKSIGFSVKKINNIVDIPQSNRARKNKDASVLNILVSARLSPEKNQLVVVDAFEALNIGKKIVINFAGNIQDESYAALVREKIRKNSNVNISYNFLGYVKDVDSLYASCDCVILPSLTEGTPNVVLECFARRVPVLASDIPQNRVLFQDKSFLFNPSSAKSLIHTFENFLATKEIQLQNNLDENFSFVQSEFGRGNANEYVKLMESY